MSEEIGDSVRRQHVNVGYELIREAVAKSSFNPAIFSSAMSIFHLFYQTRSFAKNDAFTIAMGCFFLACKVEEQPVMLRDVVQIFYQLYMQRNGCEPNPLDVGTELYSTWKNELIVTERLILKELGFSLYAKIEHATQYILYIVNMISPGDNNSVLSQSAWYYINESKRIDVELRFVPICIACSCILLASKIHNVNLQNKWWEIFHIDENSMKEVCEEILSMYDHEDDNNVKWLPPLYKVDYLEQTNQYLKQLPQPQQER